jgi:hypothetical protein
MEGGVMPALPDSWRWVRLPYRLRMNRIAACPRFMSNRSTREIVWYFNKCALLIKSI